jgi:hypothetical protein
VDSDSYVSLSSVKLLEDADSIGYDPKTKYLYIDNGGGAPRAKKLADIKVDGDTLEAWCWTMPRRESFFEQQSQEPGGRD